MQITKQMLRVPFLGQQNNDIKASRTNNTATPPASPRDPTAAVPPAIIKTYTSKELFGVDNELSIAHRGERYSLRITSLGKLILTK